MSPRQVVIPVVLSYLLCAFVVLVFPRPRHTSSPSLSPPVASLLSDCADITEITVDTIQRLFRSGALTSRALVTCYLQRIEDYDNVQTFKGYVSYPTNAVLELNPEALSDADARDRERARCTPHCDLSKLHGIPVLLKDNVAADGMETTAGSFALVGGYHSPAFITGQILEAGGIILGKAGLSEWASWRSSREDPYVRYTIKPRVNVTNPYPAIPSAVTPGLHFNVADPSIVMGSSSGSAVAAAANLAVLTIGTETTGSILFPSQANGVVGIKPTVGLVSRQGIVPLSLSQDTAGPICRTVTDAVYLLDVIAAPDPTDAVTLTQQRPDGGYTQFLRKDGLKGKKIAIGPNKRYKMQDEIQVAYAAAAAFMRSQGASVDILLDAFDLPGSDLVTDALLYFDFKHDVQQYLADVTWAPDVTPKRDLRDLIEFNYENYQLKFQGGRCCRGLPAYGNYFQDIFEAAQETAGFDDPTYVETKANATQAKELLRRFFESNGYDAVTSLGEFIDDFARTQQPSITVPLALTSSGYPVGIIFHGVPYKEGTLIEIAYAFGQGFGFGRPLPTYCNGA